jgi:hypothetical protein
LAPKLIFVAAPAAEGQGLVSKFSQAKAAVDNSSLKTKVRIFLNKQFRADCTKFSYVLLHFQVHFSLASCFIITSFENFRRGLSSTSQPCLHLTGAKLLQLQSGASFKNVTNIQRSDSQAKLKYARRGKRGQCYLSCWQKKNINGGSFPQFGPTQ